MTVDSPPAVETVHKVLGGAALAFGAAGLLAPRALLSAYGMSLQGGESMYLARMWGARMAFIGALSLAATGELRRTSFMLGAALGGVDTVLSLATPGLSAQTRIQGATTASVIGSMALYALRES